MGLRCTRTAKTRDQERSVTPKHSIAPNPLGARDSHISQFSTSSLLEHPAIQDTSSLGPVNMPPKINLSWGRKRESLAIDDYPIF